MLANASHTAPVVTLMARPTYTPSNGPFQIRRVFGTRTSRFWLRWRLGPDKARGSRPSASVNGWYCGTRRKPQEITRHCLWIPQTRARCRCANPYEEFDTGWTVDGWFRQNGESSDVAIGSRLTPNGKCR
jgi:hypothetical protein